MRQEIKDLYKSYGIDVDEAMDRLSKTPISLQCWQLDDVTGFETKETSCGSNGTQVTGSYLGKATNFEELTQDFDEAIKFIPGKKHINLHASYQSDNEVDRADITIDNYKRWIDYAKSRNIGIDFNPTIFASDMLVDNLSLSSPLDNVREYWIRHCINSIKVTEAFGKALGHTSLCNIWIPDGLKDVPADRLGPRTRLKDSLDKILAGYDYDPKYCAVSVESKVFGIGLESFTVGSHEFYMNYAANNRCYCLLDTGHFHPTESVADKIPSMLLFKDHLAFHVSRPVRWDSDHVLKLNDDLQDIADELVKCGGLEKAYIGLDFFDASINRVAALVIGARNIQKALLKALLTPWNLLSEAQDAFDHTRVLALQEELKTLPWGEVWDEYCLRNNASTEKEWYEDVKKYEHEVLEKRGN